MQLFLLQLKKQEGQADKYDVLTNVSSMTDVEKQALLEEKYREHPLFEDEFDLSVIKGSLPVLIPTLSENWIYGYFDEIGEDGSVIDKFIMVYDLVKDSLYFLVPPGSSDYGEYDMYRSRYKDYKLYGSHLYLIHADLGHLYLPYAPYSIYCIDINDFSWQTIGEAESYGEKTIFVGDKIKAQVYFILNECEDYWENEYADSIKWIKLK